MRAQASAWDREAWRGAAFWPIHQVGRAFEGHGEWPRVEEYDAVIGPVAGVHFREQEPRPRRWRRNKGGPRRSYDAWICEDGVVPSRAGSWHDFFNALVWGAFPRAKRALHRRQYAAQLAASEGRTREGDALALLDEGGVVLLCAEDALVEMERALAAREVERIEAAVACGVLVGCVYGHAIYEHMARGAPAVRAVAHVVGVEAWPEAAHGGPEECVALADEALAGALEEGRFGDPEGLASVAAEGEILSGPRGGAGLGRMRGWKRR